MVPQINIPCHIDQDKHLKLIESTAELSLLVSTFTSDCSLSRYSTVTWFLTLISRHAWLQLTDTRKMNNIRTDLLDALVNVAFFLFNNIQPPLHKLRYKNRYNLLSLKTSLVRPGPVRSTGTAAWLGLIFSMIARLHFWFL